jgi:Sec-independent protein translocase protein TatA
VEKIKSRSRPFDDISYLDIVRFSFSTVRINHPLVARMPTIGSEIGKTNNSAKKHRIRRLAWRLAFVGIATLAVVTIASRPDMFRNAWRALDDERRYWDGRRRELDQKRRARDEKRRAEEQAQTQTGSQSITNGVPVSQTKP